jgi:prepilin peptidase CpaA
MSLPILDLAPLGLGVAWAIVCDLRRRRIPNAISGLVLVIGIAVRVFHGGWPAGLSSLAASVLLLAVLYPAWRAGGIGGGDVKLAAATAAWVGLSHLVWFALSAAVAGGVVAAICYLFAPPSTRAEVRANLVLAGLQGNLPPAEASHRKGHVSLPYAVAIGGGAAVALLVI